MSRLTPMRGQTFASGDDQSAIDLEERVPEDHVLKNQTGHDFNVVLSR
jgi:hypothetical protein